MLLPKRLRRQQGRYAQVDGIPFTMPVATRRSPVLMAAFTFEADKAVPLMEGREVHPLRLWGNKGVLVITVINYQDTTIGQYIEFSIGIACTHGAKPAPALLPALLMPLYGTGQYVFDLPVSSEISVKGGKGIWGMPKHQASLDFRIEEDTVSSQYDLDGQLAMRITIQRPKKVWLPMALKAANYCAFRGMLMKSVIYFRTRLGFIFARKGAGELLLGDHPRLAPLKQLKICPDPLLVAFMPEINGTLDDRIESWFLDYAQPPGQVTEGLETTYPLGLSEDWPPPPTAHGRLEGQQPEGQRRDYAA